jgi:hypothetical protein
MPFALGSKPSKGVGLVVCPDTEAVMIVARLRPTMRKERRTLRGELGTRMKIEAIYRV